MQKKINEEDSSDRYSRTMYVEPEPTKRRNMDEHDYDLDMMPGKMS